MASSTNSKSTVSRSSSSSNASRTPRTAKSTTQQLPTKELNNWLAHHHTWNHQEWLDLLAELEQKGHKELAATQEGRESVGSYLETHRH